MSTHREHKQFQKLAPTGVLWASDTTEIASDTSIDLMQELIEITLKAKKDLEETAHVNSYKSQNCTKNIILMTL